MAKSYASPRLLLTIAASLAIFTIFTANICTAELSEMFHGYNLTAIAAINGSFDYYDNHGHKHSCEAYPRILPTTDSRKGESATEDEFERRIWDINCIGVISLAIDLGKIKCPTGMTPNRLGGCSPIAD